MPPMYILENGGVPECYTGHVMHGFSPFSNRTILKVLGKYSVLNVTKLILHKQLCKFRKWLGATEVKVMYFEW